MSVFAMLVLLIAIPIVELAVIVLVAGMIGVLPTVALVAAVSLAGFWLMKAEGIGVLRRMQAQVGDGQVPAREVVDGVLVLVGGLLMLLPGFVTGFFGLLLLLPPVRALLRPLVLARARRRVERGQAQFAAFTTSGSATSGFGTATSGFGPSSFGGPVYDADAHLVPGHAGSTRPESPRPELGS
jgi:UPF0716 protein FxsA